MTVLRTASLALVALLLGATPLTPTLARENLPKIKPGDPLPANLFVELAKAINPTVVNISTSTMPRYRGGNGRPGGPQYRDPFFDLFEQFMGPNMQQQPQQSLGTGFIIREDGLIITNNHVVDQADVIKVQLSENSKESFTAEVIGKDSRTDIALIKINTKKKLPVAVLGSSQELEVGEWVAAFGNPFGHGHTLTKGVVSAKGREIEGLNLFPFIQTDASINPGNSGGPLVNVQGQVVGVNSAIDARAQGIGFAIPIDEVKSILPQLEKDGGVRRGFIGVYMADLDEESAQSLNLKQTEGALITQVVENSPADKAGLKPYDLVIEFGGEKVTSTAELSKAVIKNPVGKKVELKALRNNKAVTLNLVIGEQTAEKVAKPAKKYDGQKAPFNLGFTVTDYTRQLADNFGVPPLREGRPIVIDVEMNSPAIQAGVAPGDVILDVNRQAVAKAKDVLKALRSGINVMRVLKQDRVVLIYIRPK